MKDIDFDELDRAVSSVLGQQGPKKDDGVTTAQTVTAEEPVETTSAPDAEAPVETTPPVEEQPAASATPLAVKRRGKFMDVMHPSADMTSATPTAPVKPRTSSVLQPLSDNVTPEAPAPEAAEAPAGSSVVEPTAELDESHALIGAEPAPVENLLPEHAGEDAAEATQSSEATSTEEVSSEPVAATEPMQQEATEPVKSLYVDPLDLAKPDEQPAEEVEGSDNQQSEEASEEQSGTPFLPDAQVDKRPLGAFGEAENTSAEAPVAAPEQAAQSTDNTQASPAVPLPRELQPDVVEVESAAQDAETSPVPLTSEVKADEVDDGRVEGHPLFDTSTYHEPIAAAHGKGMPGWVKWLIGLLVCLALGAGVGYFLFTAGL